MNMNIKYAQSSLALALGLSLAGCHAVTPLAALGPTLPGSTNSTPGSQTSATAPGQAVAEVQPVGMSELPQVDLTSTVAQTAADGQLKLAIRWPERAARSTQVIPTSANSLRIRIYQASDSVELVNEVIERGTVTETQWPYGSAPASTVSRSYSLKKNVPYKVEVKVYAELKANVTADSTAIAFTSVPSDVTMAASTTQNLALTLAALYTPVVTPASYAIGTGASLTIRGSGFGTDKNLVKLLYKTSNTDSGTDFASSIATISNTAITFTVPTSGFYNSGNLYVSRDGVNASESVALYPINNLSIPTTGFKQAQMNTSPWTNYNLAIAGATYSVTALANGYIGNSYTQLENATYSLQVFDKTSGTTEVTATTVNGSVITFPNAAKKYQIKVVSGNVSNTLDVQAGTVSGWPTSVATVSVAPYYLPNFGADAVGNTLTNSVDLSGISLTAPDISTSLGKDDIDWSYGGNVAMDTNTSQPSPRENPTSTKAIFKATSNTTGTVPVTATLKGAPANTFSFNANVVKISSLGLQNYINYPTYAWTNASTASIATNGSLQVRLGSYNLSDGQTVSLSDSDRQKLSPYQNSMVAWSFQNNTSPVSSKNDGDYAQTTVTGGGAAGTATIRMKYNSQSSYAGETAIYGSIIITLQ